jgi:hypothetical protein
MNKKLAAALVAAGLIFAAAQAAGAASSSIPPSGLKLLSPSTAASGSPMWVRSSSPCPAKSKPQVFRSVQVWIDPPGGTLRGDIDEVTGDVDPDGSWRVTISAPSSPAAGATASYYVRAACLEDDPWAAAPLDEDAGVKPVAVAYYEVNPLRVTSSGDGTADGGDVDYVPDPTKYNIVTTTTAPRETTTTTVATTSTTAGATTSTTAATTTTTGVTTAALAKRVSDIKAELAAQGVDVASMSDAEILLAAPAAAHRPMHDGGLPWWSFVLATILAVGTVIAWGARKRVSDADLV